MLPQLKRFKRASRSIKRIFLGLISCMLCLLLSEPFLITLGQSKGRVISSDLVEYSKVQTSAQTAASPTDGKPEPQALVVEVVVQGVLGKLQELVYQAVGTKPGKKTTRSQLEQDINAIFAMVSPPIIGLPLPCKGVKKMHRPQNRCRCSIKTCKRTQIRRRRSGRQC